jgi:hypothetical protein
MAGNYIGFKVSYILFVHVCEHCGSDLGLFGNKSVALETSAVMIRDAHNGCHYKNLYQAYSQRYKIV